MSDVNANVREGRTGSAGSPIGRMVSFLTSVLGHSYVRGATGQNGAFDCSGLVTAAYQQLGVSLPALSYSQVQYGQGVDVNHLEAGDLVFFNGDGGRDFGHVGIYIGNGRYIQAASTKLGVIESTLDPGRVQGARRIVDGNGALIRGNGMLAGHQAYVPVVEASAAVPVGQLNFTPSPVVPGSSTNQDPANGRYTTGDPGVDQYIRTNYGYLGGFVNDPEIGTVIRDAARQGWSKDRLFGALANTNWWRNTSSSARQWQQLQSEDPAEAASQVSQRKADIQNQIRTMGIDPASINLDQVAAQSLQFGWNSAQIIDQVLSRGQVAKGGAGSIQSSQEQIKALAAQYLLPTDGNQLNDWSMRIASGELTIEGLRGVFASQAKAQFASQPDMQKLIDEGVTPSDYFAQHKAAIASTLEVDPNAIDLISDPKWKQIMSMADPTTGKIRPMTITEATTLARKDPTYANTGNGRQAAASAASVMTAMGYR